jgi:hypothetical protein
MTTHSHAFATSVRLLDIDGTTELIDFHDPDAGYLIGDEIVLPAPNKRRGRIKSSRTGGSYRVGPRVPDDGVLIVPISVLGATWPAKETAYQALYDVLDALDEFYVEVILSGVTTRWYSDDAVDVFPEPITGGSRVINSQDYELRFLVQPSPVVTIGA